MSRERENKIKAFREARIAGEEKLSRGEISWEQFSAAMIDRELTLKELGVSL